MVSSVRKQRRAERERNAKGLCAREKCGRRIAQETWDDIYLRSPQNTLYCYRCALSMAVGGLVLQRLSHVHELELLSLSPPVSFPEGGSRC